MLIALIEIDKLVSLAESGQLILKCYIVLLTTLQNSEEGSPMATCIFFETLLKWESTESVLRSGKDLEMLLLLEIINLCVLRPKPC